MGIFTKKINKFTLYVGLNDKDTRQQEIATGIAQDKISKILAEYGIEGATFLGAKGIYTYITDNKTEQENTFKIEILFASVKQIKKAIEKIKKELNQETIAKVQEKVSRGLF